MKKIIALIFSAALVLSVCGMTVSAGCHGKSGKTVSKTCVCSYCSDDCKFVDADKDGICDNCGKTCKFVDADKDGKCDTCGKTCKFVDADKDGKCDNCGKKHNVKSSAKTSGGHHGKHGKHC